MFEVLDGELVVVGDHARHRTEDLVASDAHAVVDVAQNSWLEVMPMRPIGRPRRGKPQLRIDEARRFVAFALERAQLLDVGATAALMQIFLGL